MQEIVELLSPRQAQAFASVSQAMKERPQEFTRHVPSEQSAVEVQQVPCVGPAISLDHASR